MTSGVPLLVTTLLRKALLQASDCPSLGYWLKKSDSLPTCDVAWYHEDCCTRPHFPNDWLILVKKALSFCSVHFSARLNNVTNLLDTVLNLSLVKPMK